MTLTTPLQGRTLYDKIWDDHVIHGDEALALIYIDRHLVHEVSSPQAFDGLKAAGRVVRRPDCTLATVDHNIPTLTRKRFKSIDSYVSEPNSRAQCNVLEENVKTFNLQYFGMNDRRQGIVHVIGPEQGFTLPGITCVCGDSHSSTHGAFGSLAFGIGTSEVEHVLATQTLLQKKSKNMRIAVDGDLNDGVTSKDVILHIIGTIGTAGATGCVIEYTGSVIRNFSMEARMSICNMSIEAGARAGMVAPDDVTFDYLKGRPLAPRGNGWDAAVEYWRALRSDDGAHYDIDITIAASDIVPTVTWGTSPQDIVPVTGSVPDPSSISDPNKRAAVTRALEYMGLEPNTPMEAIKLDKVFIGSCTNSRIEDLRAAAKVIIAAGPGATVPPGIQALVVPGSGLVKQHAEAEGLDVVFTRAGFEWREAGCSMCIGMNADMLGPGERCASTSNRNFRGRQGPGGRTHLMSPAMAAAAALNGKITDVRRFTGRIEGDRNGSSVSLEINIRDLGILQNPEVIIRSTTAVDSHSGNFALPSPQPSMEKFTVLKGIAAPIHLDNIDTDVIIPVPFCKTLKRTGLAEGLFHPLRNDPASGALTNFVLNVPPYNRARIIVCTGLNFGCGSSREHAPWALKDFGILCIIAPSFGEIFRNNTMQNGMLPISIPQEECRVLAKDAEASLNLEIDLEREEIRRANGSSISFTIDPFRRHCLLNGLDDITLTMQKESFISEFEKRRTQTWPWLDGLGFHGKIVPVISSKDTGKVEW